MYKVSKETYEKVIEACGHKCVLCGKTQGLQLHHICGRGKFLTDMPENCVMLCLDCHHNKVHGNNKYYKPLLKEIAEKIYGVKIYDGPQTGRAWF